jgi:5-methylcytosine-specific restriction enzyme subunit McrC
MLAHALGGVTWQDDTVGVEKDADVVHVLAEAYLRAATRALRPGLIQGYRLTEESLPVVRGRIRIDEQLKRRPGVWLPIEVSYDDFTVDTGENRILRAAAERLIRNPLVPALSRRRLTAVTMRLAEVRRLVPGAALPVWRPSRLNLRYQPALRLASLVLAATSFEHRAGDVRLDGFVVDMPLVFEGFVTETLRAALATLDPCNTVRAQYPSHLDKGQQIPMRPDIVWLDEVSRPLAVIDAKYKAEKYSGFPNADVYQALAYATALGLPDAHLVYARGNERVRDYTIRGSDVRVHAHALDLSLPPAMLLDQIMGLARSVSSRSSLVGILA